MASKEKNPEKPVANNKKAFHDYFIIESFEAGIALAGTEVKSLRQGKCSIKEAYVQVVNGEAIIYGMNISPYEQGNIFNKDPLRPRKLLMHKSEIMKLYGEAQQQGYTIMPLKVYFKHQKAKVEIGLAKGKKLYDKREAIAKKDMKREAERAMRERNSRYN
ncbi:MAG: SsrA-binding protein SmpB [Lachnospiraceae bacterium]|nr:SsrA-binding protein SmpB [Lachnospiraceae bacterium]